MVLWKVSGPGGLSVRVLGSLALALTALSLWGVPSGLQPAGLQAVACGHCPWEAPGPRAPKLAPKYVDTRLEPATGCSQFWFLLAFLSWSPFPVLWALNVRNAVCALRTVLRWTLRLPRVLSGCWHQIFIPN